MDEQTRQETPESSASGNRDIPAGGHEEDSSTGAMLRRLRRERGLSVAEVTASIKVSATNIRALEAHDYDKLPADTFVRGHLTIYAQFLDLDPRQVVEDYFQEMAEAKGQRRRRQLLSSKPLAPKPLAEPTHVSTAAIAGVLFSLLVVLFAGFCLYTSWNPFGFLQDSNDRFTDAMTRLFSRVSPEPEQAAPESGPPPDSPQAPRSCRATI